MKLEFPKSINEAKTFQRMIADQLVIKDSFSKISTLGAFDISYKQDKAFTAGIIIDMETEEILEENTLKGDILFPYIPTYLFLREVPHFISLYDKITVKPDLILIDGHGIAHPRSTGSATVFGVLANIPSIGVAKKPLRFFEYKKTGTKNLEKIILKDKFVGYKYQSNTNWKPVYISPGNLVSVESSFKLVNKFFKKRYKLPMPLHKAHNLATEFRKTQIFE